jgi:uncharacterized membrane protein YphA (DoxX/SURF4 family)
VLAPRATVTATRGAVTVARAAVAAVWWYEGLWCKVFGADPSQRAIVADLPNLPTVWVTAVVVGIGLAETALGGWVLSGAQPRLAAIVQTGLLVAFNAGGLLFAGSRIPDPGRMVTQNAALLALVWLLAREPADG